MLKRLMAQSIANSMITNIKNRVSWQLLAGLLATAVGTAWIANKPAVHAADRSTTLKVSTDFPGGSVDVESIDQQARMIRVRPAAHPSRGWDCWWYFKVGGITPGETITVDLGGSGFALSDQATFSTDGRTWQHTYAGQRHEQRIVYRQRIGAPQAWFAWGPPFSGDDAAALAHWAGKESSSAEQFELCRSRDGRPVVGLHLAPSQPRFHGAWIVARQHAWESG